MKIEKRLGYFLLCCISLILVIVSATFAYFTASISDENTVKGDAATVTFSLNVERVTSIDMAFGLVPMKEEQAPNAALQKCKDDLGNAGCQIYKITVDADSDTVMFLDGYIVITPRVEQLETRFTRLVYDVDSDSYATTFTNDDFEIDGFDVSKYIKDGIRKSVPPIVLNHTDDYSSLLVENEKIGGDVGRQKVFYVMVFVYDNGEAQDYLQGMQLAYKGEVIFNTAEGNQISATFD